MLGQTRSLLPGPATMVADAADRQGDRASGPWNSHRNEAAYGMDQRHEAAVEDLPGAVRRVAGGAGQAEQARPPVDAGRFAGDHRPAAVDPSGMWSPGTVAANAEPDATGRHRPGPGESGAFAPGDVARPVSGDDPLSGPLPGPGDDTAPADSDPVRAATYGVDPGLPTTDAANPPTSPLRGSPMRRRPTSTSGIDSTDPGIDSTDHSGGAVDARRAAQRATPPGLAGPAGAAHATRSAGLPFLLNVADEAGIPEALADPAFERRSSRWVLAALGTCLLPVAADDPALLALCGLTPDDPSPLAGAGSADDAERRRLTRHARAWAAHVAARLPDTSLGTPTDPVATVARVANRSGHVVADPAWIEVHLPIDEIDVDIRGAGLDLDPGWLPWLGAVVRFVYDEEPTW
jgi:hypothetical protein